MMRSERRSEVLGNLDMMWVWLMIFAFFAIFEFMTPGNLITIWFASGALGALLVQQLGANIVIQVLIFLIVSFGSLLLMRPMTQNLMRGDTVATNADRLIGHQFKLENDLDPKSWYQQTVNSDTWSIISARNKLIPANTWVEVISIDGVKLVVREVKERENA